MSYDVSTADASLPVDSQQSLHHMALKHVLYTESKPEVYEFSLARCRAFASRSVLATTTTECVGPQPILMLFLNGLWPAKRAAEIKSLFHAYVEASLIDVDGPMLKPYATGSMALAPLELVVRSYRNIDAMVALIECGADVTKVPKEEFRFKEGGPLLAAPGDFLEFARNQTQNGPEFFAAAKAAIMRRVISTSASESQSDGLAPAARQRRSPGV